MRKPRNAIFANYEADYKDIEQKIFHKTGLLGLLECHQGKSEKEFVECDTCPDRFRCWTLGKEEVLYHAESGRFYSNVAKLVTYGRLYGGKNICKRI
jgi:hypothetical protein